MQASRVMDDGRAAKRPRVKRNGAAAGRVFFLRQPPLQPKSCPPMRESLLCERFPGSFSSNIFEVRK
jgi:hypothetical protein